MNFRINLTDVTSASLDVELPVSLYCFLVHLFAILSTFPILSLSYDSPAMQCLAVVHQLAYFYLIFHFSCHATVSESDDDSEGESSVQQE